MKKLFTVIALLSVFLGAKADWVQDYQIDYSTHKGFPFYVMGYVPEWIDGVMTDFGANYKYVAVDGAEETSDVTVATEQGVEYYKIAVDGGAWHQYFIADGIPTELDGSYTVKALVKASEACTINVNMGWGWGDGQQAPASVTIPASADFQEVEWEYSGIGGTSCNLVAQPGMATATIEWKSVTVSHNQKAARPVEWIENLENGNAEKSWAEMGLADVKYNDMENNYKICAWGKEREVNMNEDGGWDPFPATIETEADGNKVFVVHGKPATTEGDASAWDNQFWIESPKEWKSGTALKIKFRYKASKAVTVATQCHHQKPSDYLIWHAIGDINFTEEWQEFDGTMNIADDMNGTWGIAFQLNQNDKEAIDFYFDDLSWQHMKLDEGYFVAGCNPNAGLEYDFDNAVQFTEDADAGCWVATIGEKNAYVSQIMISTVRGNDAAFKGATLKPAGAIKNDPDEWLDYTESSLAKLNLPGEGIWKIYLDDNYKAMSFEMIEGNVIEPIVINPNPTVIVIDALERDWLTADNDGNAREDQIGTGQPWDNQFWIVANRELSTGEVTVIEFDYVATADAKSTTQCHSTPGNYLHWGAIGDVNFTTAEQHFEATFTVPSEANNMQSIAFNLSEIKAANTYTIKNVIWRLEDSTESLIKQTGGENFYVKILGGNPEPVETGIKGIVTDQPSSAAIYNLAGQRVDKAYKGIVVKEGKKYIAK